MNIINDLKINCLSCQSEFIFTIREQEFYAERGFAQPKRCPACRKQRRLEIDIQNKQAADREWQSHEERKIKKLLKELPYNRLSLPDVTVDNPSKTLYVIGNGFDIAHGVPSRYINFRDSMGKNNNLRRNLETYLKVDDLWSDFEEALAHIDGSGLLGTVDMWLDIMGAYQSDAQAADFCMAYETAAEPAMEILRMLPKSFRMWVATLKPSKEPVYKNLLHPNGTYLNFNYTEFPETLYNIPSQNIKYIHGCRTDKKQNLILGHAFESGEDDDWTPSLPLPKYKSKRKQQMLTAALDGTTRYLADYMERTTKNTKQIIAENQEFFEKLSDIETIVVIGHSLSFVDYPYFREIIKYNQNKANWLITWHSSRDLKNSHKFVKEMNIVCDKITLLK